MQPRHLLTAALLTAVALSACSTSDTAPSATPSTTSEAVTTTSATTPAPPTTEGTPVVQPAGIVLPTGLTTVDELVDAFDRYDGYLVADSTVTDGTDTVGTARIEYHPNGDRRQEQTFGDIDQISETLVFADGTVFYTDLAGNWVKTVAEESDLEPFSASITFNGTVGTIEETVNGYRIVNGDVADELVVDNNRVVIEMRYLDSADETPFVSASTISYPPTLPALEAPVDFIDEAESNGMAARALLREATSTVAFLFGVKDLPDITANDVADGFNSDMAYVTTEVSFDPYSLAFANDGTTIEMVVSDNIGTCYRTTLDADGNVDTVEDDFGAMNDFGFACSTTIVHSGPPVDYDN